MPRKLSRRAFTAGAAVASATFRFAPAIAQAAPFRIGLRRRELSILFRLKRGLGGTRQPALLHMIDRHVVRHTKEPGFWIPQLIAAGQVRVQP